MAMLATKRMARERQMLQTENEDYFAFFHDDNLLSFDAYVVGPEDSLYRHKLVKLHFDIPYNYPMVSEPLTKSRPPDSRYLEAHLLLRSLPRSSSCSTRAPESTPTSMPKAKYA